MSCPGLYNSLPLINYRPPIHQTPGTNIIGDNIGHLLPYARLSMNFLADDISGVGHQVFP